MHIGVTLPKKNSVYLFTFYNDTSHRHIRRKKYNSVHFMFIKNHIIMNSFIRFAFYLIIWRIVHILADRDIIIPKICKAPLLLRALESKIPPFSPPYYDDNINFITYHISNGESVLSFCPAKSETEKDIEKLFKIQSEHTSQDKTAPEQDGIHLPDLEYENNISIIDKNNKNDHFNQQETPSKTQQYDEEADDSYVKENEAESGLGESFYVKENSKAPLQSAIFSTGTLLFPRPYKNKLQCARAFKPSIEKRGQCEQGAYFYNVGYWVWIEADKMSAFSTFYKICFSDDRGIIYTRHKIRSTELLQNSDDFDISNVVDICKNQTKYKPIETGNKPVGLQKILSFTNKSPKKDKERKKAEEKVTTTSRLLTSEQIEDSENISASTSMKHDEDVYQNDQKNENEKDEESLTYNEILVTPEYIEQIQKLDLTGNSKYQLVPFYDMPIHAWQITTLFYFNVIPLPTEFKTYLDKVDNFIRMAIVKEQINVVVHTKPIIIEQCTILMKVLIYKYTNKEKIENQAIAIVTQEPYAQCPEICTDICEDSGWEEIKEIDGNGYTSCCAVDDETKQYLPFDDFKLLKLGVNPPAPRSTKPKHTQKSISLPSFRKTFSFSHSKKNNRLKSFP